MERSLRDEVDILHMVEQAMRLRMVWEEVVMAHWGRPSAEVKAALTAAAGRWGVPIVEQVTTMTAVFISGGSWE
ncbi:hypothetical protein ACFW6F_39890 [Streptomyces sp. NPDC058746]|uniref:hypothetical protein n=1 Tax=Streptomyces sp. NPDC058746 TaxID=3346622 RepID=UPI0036C64CBD